MMHMNFCMHEILTAAGTFYKIAPCNIQNPNAADNFSMHVKFSMHIPKHDMQSKNLVIVMIIHSKNYHMQEMFLIR